ncbi:MAG: glycosyltransferase family 2 protein [Bacteroidales bacterium]|nr:glycosyltransferase family 2 protein [Bacteroidales bacterium]
MTEQKISVITVCFNSLEMLKKTMQSVDSQTYTNYEYIVIDGNSTDGTLDFLKNYEGKLTKYVSESDQGIYDAMNKGVKMSSGDYVIFLNAGDLFADATTLEKIFKDKIYDSDVIYGDVIKNGKIKPAEKPHNAHKMYFCHQSCFTKLTCLRQFPFDTKYKMSADFNFFKILTLNNKTFKQLNIPIAIFDTTGVSNTKRSKGLKENINVVNEHDNIINKVRLLPRLYFVYWYAKLRGK